MAAAKSAIEKELVDATGLKRKVAEKPQLWMERLIKGAQALKEDDWDKLTEPTQLWVNAGTKAIKGEKDIPDFPGADDNGEPEKEERTSSRRSSRSRDDDPPERKSRDREDDEPRGRRGRDADEEAPRGRRGREEPEEDRPRRGRAREETDEPKSERSSKRESGDGEKRKVGAQTAIKKLLCKQPKLSTEDLLEKLEKQGYHPTPLAVSSIRSGFRNTVKIMNEMGLSDVDLD